MWKTLNYKSNKRILSSFFCNIRNEIISIQICAVVYSSIMVSFVSTMAQLASESLFSSIVVCHEGILVNSLALLAEIPQGELDAWPTWKTKGTHRLLKSMLAHAQYLICPNRFQWILILAQGTLNFLSHHFSDTNVKVGVSVGIVQRPRSATSLMLHRRVNPYEGNFYHHWNIST